MRVTAFMWLCTSMKKKKKKKEKKKGRDARIRIESLLVIHNNQTILVSNYLAEEKKKVLCAQRTSQRPSHRTKNHKPPLTTSLIKLVRVLAKLFLALYQFFFLCLHLYANIYEYI